MKRKKRRNINEEGGCDGNKSSTLFICTCFDIDEAVGFSHSRNSRKWATGKRRPNGVGTKKKKKIENGYIDDEKRRRPNPRIIKWIV